MFNLNKHLDSDEKIVKFFRPSRLAYLLQYLIHIILLILAIIFSFYNEPGSHLFIFWNFVNLISKLVLVYSIIMLLRLEYRIWSRRYALTNERLMYSMGIFSEKFKSSSYKYITDIAFHQTFWDKIMNTGTLTINTAGTDRYEIRYRKIRNPLEIKKIINDRQTHIVHHVKKTKKKSIIA
ncbi:TPA: PH domain-containing protein [Candidatus Woesearchaeota archaeon]|nr:PH domain-containing protein [Candidatus Woesearchaeota archaeon]HIH31637.1 PH domain-containing protein [Candidatus Woesearchaeota archaeon]HIH55434.1 PH domain-containing protein [Candidatus Woesearchaeota archaeon]HIJ02060.1 PH domain-containing protein [Candidatus Woesearchaeota archaeon]HIJ14625.1 PH domain-containing protein [Candidatus Woesearchaeota archaeon]